MATYWLRYHGLTAPSVPAPRRGPVPLPPCGRRHPVRPGPAAPAHAAQAARMRPRVRRRPCGAGRRPPCAAAAHACRLALPAARPQRQRARRRHPSPPATAAASQPPAAAAADAAPGLVHRGHGRGHVAPDHALLPHQPAGAQVDVGGVGAVLLAYHCIPWGAEGLHSSHQRERRDGAWYRCASRSCTLAAGCLWCIHERTGMHSRSVLAASFRCGMGTLDCLLWPFLPLPQVRGDGRGPVCAGLPHAAVHPQRGALPRRQRGGRAGAVGHHQPGVPGVLRWSR